MSKYTPLNSFLASRASQEVPMSFHEIEKVIDAPLPPVAFKHRAWWSNNPSNSVITRAWLDAGYKTERVDMGGQKLVFRRAEAQAEEGIIARLQRRLGGTVTVPEGVDLTEPTGEIWDAQHS